MKKMPREIMETIAECPVPGGDGYLEPAGVGIGPADFAYAAPTALALHELAEHVATIKKENSVLRDRLSNLEEYGGDVSPPWKRNPVHEAESDS